MKVKLLIEYDGTKFCGWQDQEGVATVQGTIEQALKAVLNQKTTLWGAGRTDSGVHAVSQAAHFEIIDDKSIQRWKDNLGKLVRAINFYIRDTGAIVFSATQVSNSFHARFSAIRRTYQYLILNRPVDSPLLKNKAWHVGRELDIVAMKQAASLFLGHHNFNAFRSADCQALTPHRTVDAVSVVQDGSYIFIKVTAKSFLHNQVRIMVGTLVDIGLGKKTPEIIEDLLISGDRTKAGVTAPPFGLYFLKVDY